MTSSNQHSSHVIGDRIRQLRRNRQMTLQQLGDAAGLSIQQLHRLERGHRRMTLDVIEAVSKVLGVDVASLMRSNRVMVPVLGVLDADTFVNPLPPDSEVFVPAPFLGVDPGRLGAYRWLPDQRIALMEGHRVYFCRDIDGIDSKAWGQRSIIRLEDGSQRMGWLIRQGDQVHVGQLQRMYELDVKVAWASKVLGVLPPEEDW